MLPAASSSARAAGRRVRTATPTKTSTNMTSATIVNVGRIAVVAVGAVAAVIAGDPDSKVLGLVSNAWAGFGAAFGPLMILSLTWQRMTGVGAVAGLVTGAVTVIAWISLGWNASFLGGPGVYEIIPGFILSMIAIVVVSLATEARGEFRAAVAH